MILALIIVGWLICAVLTAGMSFAYFEEKYPIAKNDKRENLGESLIFGLVFGPFGVIVVFFLSGFAKRGWRLW